MPLSAGGSLLPAVLGKPGLTGSFTVRDWGTLLSEARRVRMLARLTLTLEEHNALSAAPAAFQEAADGALVYARFLERRAHFELQELDRQTADRDYPIVLLKGAAYIAQQNAAASGRGLSDIDILVPRRCLDEFESLLAVRNWSVKDELSAYDLRYYREYSHELPPHWHADFQFELDVHHNILQPTHRLAVDATHLLEEAQAVEGTGFLTFSKRDQIIHSATHLVMSDELRGGLRDVHDILLLYAEGRAQNPEFPAELVSRAFELGLQRPLYYCLDFARRQMSFSLPEASERELSCAAPGRIADSIMSAMVDRRLMPRGGSNAGDLWAERLLYLRSHWIRMPPLLLAQHLSRKAVQRSQPQAA